MSYYASEEDDIYLPPKEETAAPPTSTSAAAAVAAAITSSPSSPSSSRASRKSRTSVNSASNSGSSKHRTSGKVDVEAYRENNMVGNYADPVDGDNDRKRRSRRKSALKATNSGTLLADYHRHDDDIDDDDEYNDEQPRSTKSRRKFLALGSSSGGTGTKRKSKKKKRKSRQEQIYDDLYGGTNYQEVDDGIVGCADDLCVNKADYLDMSDTENLEKQSNNKGNKSNNSNSKSTGSSNNNNSNNSNNNNNKKPNSSSSFFTSGSTNNNDDNKDLSSPNTGEDNKNVDESEEVYIVKQRYGYFSIIFGVIQIIVLSLMMWQCGIAPMNINPMFGPYPDALSEWGGKNSILIVEDGEWWRLMTPILLHAGAIHLFCNVAVQLELGVFFEREWGSMTWLIIYLVSALGSSVLSVITMPDAVSVGSSGAVMGLFGGKIAEVVCRCCEKSDTAQDRVAHQVRKEQCVGVTCSVLVVLAFSLMPYVDWAAHLGGLLAGMFVGFMCFSIHMESYCLRLLWFLVGMALTFGFFVPCIDLMYSGDVPMNEELRDVCGYYTQNFEDYECNCMREEYLANLGNFFNDDDDYMQEGGGQEDGGARFLYQTASTIYTHGY